MRAQTPLGSRRRAGAVRARAAAGVPEPLVVPLPDGSTLYNFTGEAVPRTMQRPARNPRSPGGRRGAARGAGAPGPPGAVVDDRQALPPLPLPALARPARVVLVRHGQSTWNAEGRIQGSTDHSVLTEKGKEQARVSGEMLAQDRFDTLIHSPLARAAETAEIVWGRREGYGEATVLPTLREVDLYAFEGLLKAEGIERFGANFRAWQQNPANFEIDGHYPVQELWYRGSLAWQQVLDRPKNNTLVVAHNAVNQALIGTSLGLPPAYFRRMLQSNGAVTVLDFVPAPAGGLRVTVDRLNQSPASPLSGAGAGRKANGRIILIRHAATFSSENGLLMGCAIEESCSAQGERELPYLAELMNETSLDRVFTSPASRCVQTAQAVKASQGPNCAEIQVSEKLNNMYLAEWEGRRAVDVRASPPPAGAEPLESFYERTSAVWKELLRAAGEAGGQNVAVVSHSATISALLCHALQLGPEALGTFRLGTSSVSVVDFPDGPLGGAGVLRATNYTSHLKPAASAAAATLQDEMDFELICGWEGCV